MKYAQIIFSLILIGVVFKVYGRLKEPHHFEKDECNMCHVDIENNQAKLKPISSFICEKCHNDRKQKLSHPIEITPEKQIPGDMSLVNGKLSCITCHFVHPFSINNKKFQNHFLRRSGRGIVFCSACHKIDEKGHIVFEKIHAGSFVVTNPNGTLDDYSLQCIECHDRFVNKTTRVSGSGKWKHFSKALNHPVGVSLKKAANRNPRNFNSSEFLPEEIRLFNGKIGCGTCHNAYSKEKHMLVTNNRKSRLCLQCHIK